MRLIRFALLCTSISFVSSVYAQNGPTMLGEDEIERAVKKGVPPEVSVNLTEKSEDAVALKSCQKTLTGLKVPKNCCADPNCVRKAYAARDREQHEAAQQKKREEINKRYCLEYGGGLDICSEPSRARDYVIEVRREDRHLCKGVYNGPAAICDNVDSARAYVKKCEIDKQKADADNQAAEDKSRVDAALDAANRAAIAEPPAESYRIPPRPYGASHHLDLGLTLIGHLEGAYGGGIYAAYRPPILDERLELSLTAGSVVIVHNRLSIDNFDPINRAYGDANLSLRVLNFRKLSLAVGGSYSRIGRFGFDRLTAEMVGPTATLNVGALQLHGAYLYNRGPVDGYMTPKWGWLFRVGFRFADF